jgi:hypothetical protein
LPTYEEFSINNRNIKFSGTDRNGDSLYKSAFYGRTITPFENMFIKTNRDLISNRELASYTFTSLAKNDNNKKFLTEDGFNLFQNSSKKLLAEEPLSITLEQLQLALYNLKFTNPDIAEALKNIL